MLKIDIPTEEGYDDESGEFFTIDGVTLSFEHSLLSISEWEAKYMKHFLNNQNITPEEMLDYFEMMSLDEDFDYSYLTPDVVEKLMAYIRHTPSATTLSSQNDSNSRRVMTSEVIYAYMANARVPFECESWNIHRLLLLLGVIGEFNSKPKKMSTDEIMRRNRELNAQRRAKAKHKD